VKRTLLRNCQGMLSVPFCRQRVQEASAVLSEHVQMLLEAPSVMPSCEIGQMHLLCVCAPPKQVPLNFY
jgi:hypothetical protein